LERHPLRALAVALVAVGAGTAPATQPSPAPGDAPAGTRTLAFTNTAATPARHLLLRRVGGELRLVDRGTATIVASAPAATTERVAIRGAAGPHDDTLTIDLSAALSLPGGIDYDGGSGGWDTLVLTGGTVRHERLTQLSPSSGVFELDGLEIRYTNLEPVTDTVPAAEFAIAGTNDDDAITFSNGPLVGGLPTTTVSSPTFESVTFHGKQLVYLDGAGGNDTVTFANPVPAAGLSTLILINVASASQSAPVNYPRLAIGATGAVSLPLANDLDRLEVDTTSGAITYNDVDDIRVGEVTGVVGFFSFEGLRVRAAGDIAVTAAGTGISLRDSTGSAVIRTAAGDVTVNAGGVASNVVGELNPAIAAPAGAASVFAQNSLILSPDFDSPQNCSITASGPVSVIAGTMRVAGNSEVVSATSVSATALLVEVYTAARLRASGTTGGDVDILAQDVFVESFRSTAISSQSGDVNITTDRLNLLAGGVGRLAAPLGVVRIGTFDPTRTLNLGSLSDVGPALEISAEEVDRIDATELLLTSDQGLVTVTNPISFEAPLTLRSGGGFTSTSSGALLAPTLSLVDLSFAGREWAVAPTFVTVAPGAAIPYAGAAALSVRGGFGADTFYVTPSPQTSFQVEGNEPVPPELPGDLLDVDLAGTTGITLTAVATPSGLAGRYTFSNRQPVGFDEIESIPDLIFIDGFESGSTGAWSARLPP
jgi:hypothetical protein